MCIFVKGCLNLEIRSLFSKNSSHSDCHSSNIYLFACDFKSEKGVSSTEMSPTRATNKTK